METEKLTANIRTVKGKNSMIRLRNQGRVPGIFYGPHYETMEIDVDAVMLKNALARRKPLYQLEIAGKGDFEVIFREIQRDPVSEKIQHIDLYGITRGQKITLTIPVKIVGIPVGVRTGGGILEVLRRHLEVECLPKDLPDFIEADVTDIEVGSSIHVGDLKVENLIILLDKKTTIAAVVPPTVTKTVAAITEEAAVSAEGEAAAAGDKKEAAAGNKKEAPAKDKKEAAAADKKEAPAKGKKEAPAKEKK